MKAALAKLSAEQIEALSYDVTIEAKRRLASLKDLPGVSASYHFYGGHRKFIEAMSSAYREVILSGPAETGKTVTTLSWLHRMACTHRNLQIAVLRKTYASMPGSVIKTYEEKVLGDNHPVVKAKYGGERPEFYPYPTGSRIWIGGLDNPNRALSSERDIIYVNQTEELELADWETMVTRSTGRAGHLPRGYLIGDCNPGPPTHWILSRERAGHLLRVNTLHADNPSLYDQRTGEITPRGIETMQRLRTLTGYRRARYLDGLWQQAEGVVYDTWSNPGNVTEQAEYAHDGGDVFWCVDDGYSAGSAPDNGGKDESGMFVGDAHPLVILFCQRRGDGGFNVFDEYYVCQKLPEHVFDLILTGNDDTPARPYRAPEYAAHGPGSAALRGRLHERGIPAHFAKCSVKEGIDEMRSALKADVNGYRRILVHPRCKYLCSEMTTYAYDPNNSDVPVKAFDHGPDAVRYGNWILRYDR